MATLPLYFAGDGHGAVKWNVYYEKKADVGNASDLNVADKLQRHKSVGLILASFAPVRGAQTPRFAKRSHSQTPSCRVFCTTSPKEGFHV